MTKSSITIKALTIFIACCVWATKSMAYPVKVISPQVSNLEVEFDAYGVVASTIKHEIISEVSGQIVFSGKNITTGAKVSKGKVLYRLDNVQNKANVAQAQFSLSQANLDLVLEENQGRSANMEWDMLGDDIKAKANKSIILRKHHLKLAQAKKNNALWQLRNAKNKLAKTIIKAPCNGFIENKPKTKRDYVAIGSKIITIVCNEAYEVIADIPMFYYRWFATDYKKTMQAVIKRNLGIKQKSDVKVKVVRVIPALKSKNRSMQVYLHIEKPHKEALPVLLNEFVKVNFALETINSALRLPISTLRGLDELWVADVENRLKIIKIEPLHKNTKYVYLPLSFAKNTRVIVGKIPKPVTGLSLEVSSIIN